MKKRWRKAVLCALCGLLITGAACLISMVTTDSASIPGLSEQDRVLLRIWAVNAPGGGQTWLKGQLAAFEKQRPGLSTYLRTVSPEELTADSALLPDVVLYMPGDITTPQNLFLPLSGATENGPLREALLRCGRWQSRQYGLPLCWGAWVLAIDSALEPGSAITPAPTTLLGRPAATAPAPSVTPGYPMAAASAADCPLLAPGGAGLFTLGMLLPELPPLPEGFPHTSAGVYDAFRKRQCATALLTTGQTTAFSGLVSGGSGFPFRVMTADEVVTDQVWLAGVTTEAQAEAALLLAHLTAPKAQQALSAQGLHTVRDDLTLYAAGTSAGVEQAARRSLSAVNAYIPPQEVQQAAWQFLQGKLSLSEALLPLL